MPSWVTNQSAPVESWKVCLTLCCVRFGETGDGKKVKLVLGADPIARALALISNKKKNDSKMGFCFMTN